MLGIKILLIFNLLLFITGCGNSTVDDLIEENNNVVEDNIDDIIKDEFVEEDVLSSSDYYTYEDDIVVYDNIDLDISVMNANMTYSSVYNIVNDSSSYVGKVIKIKGELSTYIHPEFNVRKYNVIARDAVLCCVEGLEFVLSEDFDFSDLTGKEVTVIGTYNINEYESTDLYKVYYLTNAIIVD